MHFFPFNGNFYFSVGTAVWQKKHRDPGDPQLEQATDDWPKMYLDEWEKVGDASLPAADLAAVVPFTELGEDGKIAFKLIILAQDSTIQVLDKDNIYASNAWSTLSCSEVEGGSSSSPPKFTRMAYWNNMMFCIDTQGCSWNAHISFPNKAYKLSDQKQMEPVMELTATDRGPVVLQGDGYLYQRIVEEPASDGADPDMHWMQWVKGDGVESLGVASPGVMLDLRLLTQTLKDRYITTQSNLIAPLQRIQTFAKTHVTLCDRLLTLTDEYRNAADEDQRDLILEAADELIYTTEPWAMMMSQESASGYETVTLMTSQLSVGSSSN